MRCMVVEKELDPNLIQAMSTERVVSSHEKVRNLGDCCFREFYWRTTSFWRLFAPAYASIFSLIVKDGMLLQHSSFADLYYWAGNAFRGCGEYSDMNTITSARLSEQRRWWVTRRSTSLLVKHGTEYIFYEGRRQLSGAFYSGAIGAIPWSLWGRETETQGTDVRQPMMWREVD